MVRRVSEPSHAVKADRRSVAGTTSVWPCLMLDAAIFGVDRLEFALGQWKWPFAERRRDEIAAHFAMLCAEKPALWNGRVLMIEKSSYSLSNNTLRGRFFEISFADLVAWRDWGYPGDDVINGFAMGAIRAADGAYLLGVMGAASVNAGHIYFPAGTPDRNDIVGETVNLAGSVAREVEEETGLRLEDFEPAVAWTAVKIGPSLALMRHLQARENADVLRARILANLERQKDPELADIRIVRSPDDYDPQMPQFMIAFLDHALAR